MRGSFVTRADPSPPDADDYRRVAVQVRDLALQTRLTFARKELLQLIAYYVRRKNHFYQRSYYGWLCLRDGRSPSHIGVMPHLDLSDEEEAVLAVELVQLISRADYRFSDRVRTSGAIVNKLRPEPASEPLPPPKVYAPPSRRRSRR